MSVRMSEELVDPERRRKGQPCPWPGTGIQLTSIGGSVGHVIVYGGDQSSMQGCCCTDLIDLTQVYYIPPNFIETPQTKMIVYLYQIKVVSENVN